MPSTRCIDSCPTSNCSSARVTTRRRVSWPALRGDVGRQSMGVRRRLVRSPPNVLAKAEYVNQKYFGYPVTNIKSGGHFSGVTAEGVIGF